jgi:hypothetical protein
VTGAVTTRNTRSTRPVLEIECTTPGRQENVIVLPHDVVLAVWNFPTISAARYRNRWFMPDTAQSHHIDYRISKSRSIM